VIFGDLSQHLITCYGYVCCVPDYTEWHAESGGETIEVASAAARVTPHLRASVRRLRMPPPPPAPAPAPAPASVSPHPQSSSRSLAADLLYGGGGGDGGLSPAAAPGSRGKRDTFASGTIQETDGASNGFTPCEKPVHLNLTSQWRRLRTSYSQASTPNLASQRLRGSYPPIHVRDANIPSTALNIPSTSVRHPSLPSTRRPKP